MKTITLFLMILSAAIFTTTQVCESVEIELPELDKAWRPGAEPTTTKQDHTNTASFALKIKNLPYDYNQIDIKLIDVSKWQGICGNYPLSGAKKDRDLKFIKSQNTKWKYESDTHLSYKTSTQRRENTVEGTVIVTAYDYAAYGKLEVSVRTRTWKVGPFEGYADALIPKTVTIPLDENGNQIADGWNDDDQQTHTINGVTKNGWNAAADDENVLNTNHGDGYSVFEEYRGFWTGSNHIELSPTAKDAIICPEDDDGDINTKTTRDMWWHEYGAASAIPSHSFHIIHQTYVKDPFKYSKVFKDGNMKGSVNANNGWVNVNSKKIPGYKQAWAIRIDKKTYDPTETPHLVVRGRHLYNILGKTALGPPSQKSYIRIFYQTIRNHVWWKTGSTDNTIIDPLVKKVIAHEIGHCLHIDHCSVPWSKTNDCIMQQQSTNPRDVKTKFQGHADGSHECDYALTGSPPSVTAPHNTQGEGFMDEEEADRSSNCDSCTTGGCPQCPTTGACGHTYQTSDSSSHAWGTPTCGDSAHATYACQISSDHKTTISGWSGSFYECQPHTTYPCGHTDLTANASNHAPKTCTQTNEHGDSCEATGLYKCQSHTCVYPPPTISCGRSGCSQTVSSATQHSATCASGHPYWTCKPSDVNRHITRTCRYSACGKSWQKCMTGGTTPICDVPWRKKKGLKCWQIY